MKKKLILTFLLIPTFLMGCNSKQEPIKMIQYMDEKIYSLVRFPDDALFTAIEQDGGMCGYYPHEDTISSPYRCNNVLGYEAEYHIPQWNLKIWENEGDCDIAKQVLLDTRSSAFFLKNNKIYGLFFIYSEPDGREKIPLSGLDENFLLERPYLELIPMVRNSDLLQEIEQMDCEEMGDILSGSIEDITCYYKGMNEFYFLHKNVDHYYKFSNFYNGAAPCSNNPFRKVELFVGK